VDTVVVQSYRRVDVPAWIARCLRSVEQWANHQGYAYRFLDDELFERLPPSYFMRTRHALPMAADLARLILARETLSEGARRVVWVDADVLVFRPYSFELPIERDHYLCREIWIEPVVRDGAVVIDASLRVNNCVCVFERGTAFLEPYIEACEQRVRAATGKLDPLLVGTLYLTELDRIAALPQLVNVGMLSPHVVHDVAAGGGPFLETLVAHLVAPLAAANLCASLRGRRFTLPPRGAAPAGWFVLDDDLVAHAIAALEARGIA